MKKLYLLLVVLYVATSNAGIYFGSRNSALVINNQSELQIETSDLMDITSGTLANTGLGVITGNNVAFTGGSYTFDNSTSDLQAVLESNTNVIQLAPSPTNPFLNLGTMIANPGGLNGVAMKILPGFNILRGQPLYFGANDVILQDKTTELSIAIQNTLNTNITLNGGTLFLQDDLRLGDDAIILDNGIVIFNSRRMALGGKASTWTGTILWDSAQDLQINGQITLNGDWMFSGTGQINGNGNVIDISGGGSIIILPHSSLTLAAVDIVGLAATGKLKIAPDSTLYLTDSVIEMDNDFNIDSGLVYVTGASTIITKEYFLTFTRNEVARTNGKVTVDRVSLSYDTLASIDMYNIRPQLIQDPNRIHVDVIEEGEIRTIREDTITYHNYRSAPLLLKYAVVAPYRPFNVFPAVNGDEYDYDVILDGNTNFIGFTFPTGEGTFIVGDNVHVRTQNLILRDISPTHIAFGQNSSLVFGNNTRINLAQNETLDYKWTFSGFCQFFGTGKILTMAPGGVIEVRGKNSQLLLDGFTIKGLTKDNIRCIEPGCSITLKDVTWYQDGDFTYSTGYLNILNNVTMVGGFNVVGDIFEFFSFNYQSTQPLTIADDSTFSLIRNMIFNYAPVNGNQTNFQFADNSAMLYMDQGTLGAPTGVTLSTGQLIVRERNFLSGTVNFAPSLLIDQPGGATLEQI